MASANKRPCPESVKERERRPVIVFSTDDGWQGGIPTGRSDIGTTVVLVNAVSSVRHVAYLIPKAPPNESICHMVVVKLLNGDTYFRLFHPITSKWPFITAESQALPVFEELISKLDLEYDVVVSPPAPSSSSSAK